MTGFEAWRLFVAVKRHFTPGSGYDFAKYNGKVNVKASTFESMGGQRFLFEKLAKQRDPINLLVANLSRDPKAWIGSIFTDEANGHYGEWIRVTESLTYVTSQQMKQFEDLPFDALFKFKDGHPPALKAMLAGSLSPIVLAVIDSIVGFTRHWATFQWDPVVKQAVHRIRSLKPFVPYDESSVKKALKKMFVNQREDSTAA